ENDEAYLAFTARNFERPATQLRSSAPTSLPSALPIQNVDIIIPSFNRFEELTLSLTSILREAQASCDEGTPCRVTIVYQNEDLPRRLSDYRPDWKSHPLLHFVFSSPPSLTRARNRGIEATEGDLVIFVDDDVILSRHYVREHVKMANAHPYA